MKPSIIITGGSNGIGRALALTYAAHSYFVYTLSRSNPHWQQPNLKHICCDVTSPEQLAQAAKTIQSEGRPVQQLICCAGYGIAGPTEGTELSAAKQQFDVNLFGVFLTIQEFLPLLKPSRGKIILISSAAGELAIPFQSFYSASKAAANKLLEAWQLELRPFGIQVSTFLLGDTKTGFTAARQKSMTFHPQYQQAYVRSIAKMEYDEQHGLSPEATAACIYRRCQKAKLPPVQTVGWQYHLFLLLQRLLPRRLVLFLIARLYA